jgi:hypothetical protein
LTSYGFVPDYDVSSEASDEDGQNVENVAELWMNGLRFEVDPHSVPFDLAEVATAQAMFDDSDGEGDARDDGEGGAFTPSIARAIAKRATAAAFNLITEPEISSSEMRNPRDGQSKSKAQARRRKKEVRSSSYPSRRKRVTTKLSSTYDNTLVLVMSTNGRASVLATRKRAQRGMLTMLLPRGTNNARGESSSSIIGVV